MRSILSLVFLSSLSATLLGQQAGPPAQSPTSPSTVRVTKEEVLLDVVVRDKKGRAIDDLKADDFQIFDNGEPKKITSFRLVQGGEAIGAGGVRTQLDPLRQIRLVTMIFHCYNNDARRLASSAALDLVKGELPQNVYMAIMTIDHKLEVLQPFTNDPDLLKKAIERATRSQNTDFSKDTEVVRAQLQQMLGPNTSGAQSPQEQVDNTNATLAAQGRNVQGSALANMAMAQMVLNMIETEQSNAMMESGRAEIWSLLDAVKEQYRLPGRKTVIYFAEGGFVIPQGMEQPFKNVISIANRSNVSFYPVDTHGLTTWSANQAGIDTLNRAAQASREQQANVTGAAVRPDEAQLFDTSIASTRANAQTTLANLADSTGGVLIANTNDLRKPLHKLAEDVETYYEISYDPEIKTYDGSFRKVAIKMASSDLRVQSRSGYFALPSALARESVLHAYEIPLLAALDSSQLPKAFSYESSALHFRGLQGEPVCELVVDVPLADVTLEKQSSGASSGRLSYVAMLKNGRGEVVKKFQNEIPVSVPAAKLEGFKTSHFIYTEHFDLTPGVYTVESAVLDGVANRISARKTILSMPPPSALGLSSVTFVRSTKDKEASNQDCDPLVVGAKVISPEVSPAVNKAGADVLPFYMAIYPDKNAAQAPQLTMELSREGQVLGRGPAPLGQPDQDGRIQFVATVPLAHLQPGEFMLRLVVKQGTESAEEKASFTLK